MIHKEVPRNVTKERGDRLTPEDFRRIILTPHFRDLYNEIIQAHRFFQLPQYYYEKWLPELGATAHAVYEVLRRKIYFNRDTGERREEVYIRQADLARSTGVKDPKTIRKALRKLEEFDFIKRDFRHYIDPKSGRPYRGADKYTVYYELPLTNKDQAEMLVRTTERELNSVIGKNSLLQQRDRESDVVLGKSSPLRAGENIPSDVNTTSNTTNVLTNVRASTGRKLASAFAKDPRVASLSDAQRLQNEAFVDQVVDTLNRYTNPRGEQSPSKHQSKGFIRRLVYLMPRRFIREALMATKDMLDDQAAGKRSLRKSPSAYFAGIARQIASREGIDLGVKWKAKSPLQGH